MHTCAHVFACMCTKTAGLVDSGGQAGSALVSGLAGDIIVRKNTLVTRIQGTVKGAMEGEGE